MDKIVIKSFLQKRIELIWFGEIIKVILSKMRLREQKNTSERVLGDFRVAYLFAGPRSLPLEAVRRGENHGAGFWGLCHLDRFGIDAKLVEPEQTYPLPMVRFLRNVLSSYWIHLVVFWKLFLYDIVFTSTAFGTQLLFTLLPLRRPLWVMHDFNITGFLAKGSNLKRNIFSFLVSHCAGIVTLSREEARVLQSMFPHLEDRIAWIPFGVDLKFFNPKPIEEKRQILVVGTDPDRDYRTLFKACEGLDIPIVITTYSSRITPLGELPSGVTVRRFSPKELVEEYNRSALVVIPLDTSKRINDAMGSSTLFEAMAMGKPIVATRTFTMESYVTDGENGLLVPERDYPAMQKAIKRVLSNDVFRRKMGANARTYAEKNLEIYDCTKKLADFFRTVLELRK